MFWGARNDTPPKIESRAVNVFFMIFTSISIAQILKFKYFSVSYMAFKIFTHNLTRRELTVHNKEIYVYIYIHIYISPCGSDVSTGFGT